MKDKEKIAGAAVKAGAAGSHLGIIITAVIVGVVAVIALAVGIHAYNSNKNTDKEVPTQNANGVSLVITEDSRITASDIAQKVSDGMIVVKMTGEWTFNSACTSSNAYLANSDKNSYPLRFQVTMADTGETILETPDVPVGSCIQNFGLPNKLDKGTYDIVVAHQAVKDGEVYSTVKTAAKIVVQ